MNAHLFLGTEATELVFVGPPPPQPSFCLQIFFVNAPFNRATLPHLLCGFGLHLMDAHFGFPEEDSSSEDGEALLGERAVDGQSLVMRIVVRVSRARWYAFLRSVFLYQNGARRELGSNPLNSGVWIGLEAVTLVVQIVAITVTLAMSKEEKPVWPLRAWALGYDLRSILGLPILVWRYRYPNANQGHGSDDLDVERQQQRTTEESRESNMMSRIQTALELFSAIWFVVGNLWIFDGTRDSFRRSPKLMRLCIGLLAWNALTYSFPFILFVLLCFCVPLIHSTLGYNMNMVHSGASEEQIARLPVFDVCCIILLQQPFLHIRLPKWDVIPQLQKSIYI